MSKFQVLTPDLVPRTLTAADVAALGGTADIIVGGSVDASPVGATTPSTGAFTTLAASGAVSGAGITALFASPPAIGGTAPAAVAATTVSATGPITFGSVGNALTAAGSSRTDALQLAAQINQITTATSGTGVILPAAAPGEVVFVFNAGASAIKVYGSGSDTIDGTAGATGVTLTNAKRAVFICVAAATWISAQLGVVSA